MVANMEGHAILEVTHARLADVLLARNLRRDARLLPPLVLPLPAERSERTARDLACLAHRPLRADVDARVRMREGKRHLGGAGEGRGLWAELAAP